MYVLYGVTTYAAMFFVVGKQTGDQILERRTELMDLHPLKVRREAMTGTTTTASHHHFGIKDKSWAFHTNYFG